MDAVRLKLERYKIEWDGPIIFVREDEVTILSPFQILQFIESSSVKVRTKIYHTINRLSSQKEVMRYLERLGERLLAIRL